MYYLTNYFLNMDIINNIVAFYPNDKYFRSETSYIMYDIIADYNIYKHFFYNIPFSDYFYHCNSPNSYSLSSYKLYFKLIDVPYEFESN